MRGLLLVAGFAGILLASSCGGGKEATSTSTTTATTPAETTSLRVYFLRGGQVWPVAREVEKTQAVATAALDALLRGPTRPEVTDLHLSTAIPAGTTVRSLAIADGIATVELSIALPDAPLSQVVYTLSQFPTVRSVEIQGRKLTRADLEAETPPILVESPLSHQAVSSPLRVRGTADTFEATFQYELLGPDGNVISKHFEMATSGSGTRGTFDFTVPFTIDRAGVGTLIVYENNMANGPRFHQQEIPLELKQ